MLRLTQVIIRLQVEGFHNWPGAFEEVAFLRDRHRHMFHIECRKSVTHDDREIEIIMFKRRVQEYLETQYGGPYCEFGSQSCEMLATEIIEEFRLDSCEVTEDGENGAIVTQL